ncbi:MAG: alpha/beta hydrolase [Vicinamibacterales bacterium]
MLDVAYGADPKQKLDVYGPPPGRGTRPAPVFVFLHGGGFREGDRAQYGYVALPLAKAGIVTVVASYRLTPEHVFPDQLDDLKGVLQWVHRHVDERGGDPAHVFVGGHSAGAVLAALAAFQPTWTAASGLPQGFVKGCVAMSGPYDLRALASMTNFAPTRQQQNDASPILHVDAPPARTIVSVGSVEGYLDSSRAFVDRIKEKGGQAELLVLDGLPHDATALALAQDDNPLTRAIIRMVTGAGR